MTQNQKIALKEMEEIVVSIIEKDMKLMKMLAKY